MQGSTIPINRGEGGSGYFNVEIKTFHASPSKNVFKLYLFTSPLPNGMLVGSMTLLRKLGHFILGKEILKLTQQDIPEELWLEAWLYRDA